MPSLAQTCHSRIKRAQHGSYAHFPGTGPAGKNCRDCKSCHGGGARWYCRKHADLIRSLGLPKNQTPINRSTAACHYYEPIRAAVPS